MLRDHQIVLLAGLFSAKATWWAASTASKHMVDAHKAGTVTKPVSKNGLTLPSTATSSTTGSGRDRKTVLRAMAGRMMLTLICVHD